ncbi:MAG TPA: L,D-transpeptidase family protein [Telluria sp.]
MLLLLALLPCSVAAQDAGSAAIRALAAQAAAAPRAPRAYDERSWLSRFYAVRGYTPAWTDQQREQAFKLLADAPTQGLIPDDYDLPALQSQAREAREPASFDAALTRAMLRYLADLRFGRVRSEYFTKPPDARLAEFDPVETLRAALAAGGPGDAVAAAEPRFPLYAPVRAALAHYRELARRKLHAVPAPRGALEAGASYAGAAALQARLELLGDLEAGAPPPGNIYDQQLAEGVRHFQARHGLEPDGVLGPATAAALQVPLKQRVRQLELTLERLRWPPDFATGRLIAVNVPAYRLWAWQDPAPGAQAELDMRVIVGAAVKTPTPLFIGHMRYLDFHPYWNVPRSILLKEMIPRLRRSPSYLASTDMELVPVGGGAVTRVVNGATLAALEAGRYRLRQRPGPKNALGAVKFVLPNPMDIYLHSTPDRELFRRTRRDLSHGCIRVEEPVALAQFVLADDPEWTLDRIQAAMAPGPTRRVVLPTVVPVLLFYATAITDRAGRVLFLRDVYGRDPVLEKALAGHAAEPDAQIVPAPEPPRE